MALIKQPHEVESPVILTGLIYGVPGIGKSTLGLSGPNSVLLDFDKGMKRVDKRYQVPSLQVDDYQTVLDLLDSSELAPYDTIVIDTLGKLVDRMAAWLIKDNVKNGRSDGQLSMQGYGAVKMQFQTLLGKLRDKGKHVIFVSHAKEEKDGETTVFRLDVQGSSGKDLVKELDFMGFMEKKGRNRSISFSPSERFYAKNSMGLPDDIVVPELKDDSPNNFITEKLIKHALETKKAEDAENAKYDAIVNEVVEWINKVVDVKTANDALAKYKAADVMWDSQRKTRALLWAKTQPLGIVYDAQKTCFVQGEKPAEKAAEKPEAQPEAKPEVRPEAKEEVKEDPKAEKKSRSKKSAA